jgi:hypothetical protein
MVSIMKTATEKAAEAPQLAPEEMPERAVAYLLEQGEKFRVLKEQTAEGMQDVAHRRFSEWNFDKFLRRAQISAAWMSRKNSSDE